MPLDELVVDEVVEDDKLKIFVDLYFWFSELLVEIEYEKRVRWTCVCGCRLYDDFHERSPGASKNLQQYLDSSDPKVAQSILSTDSSLLHDPDSDLAHLFGGTNEPEIDSNPKTTYDELRNRDIDILRRNPTQAHTLWLLPFMFEYKYPFGVSAFDVFDRNNPPDTELLIHIKKKYLKAKGKLGRFLSPRTMKTISAILEPGGCPFNMVPPIGPNYLMHLWQNPNHTDWHTYQKNKSIFDTARWATRKLLDLARTDNKCGRETPENAEDALAGQQSRQNETEKHLFRQSYIFHAIRKVPRLQYDAKGLEPGFFLIEKFDFRRFLVLFAVILWFIVHGLVLGVHFLYVAGVQGVELHLRLVEISSWITGPLMLIIALGLR